MNSLSQYNLRQILLIKKNIILFENNKIDLFEFVCNMRGLLNALEAIEDGWKDDFQDEINTLEIVNDSIKDGSISRLGEVPEKVVCKSVCQIKNIILYVLEHYLCFPDPNILESAILINDGWLMCPKCNDAWESNSSKPMVVCPNCECVFHNPRFRNVV